VTRESVLNVAVGVMVVCAITMTGAVVRRELNARVTPSSSAPSTVPDWRRYASVGQRIGPRDARVTIVEFSDFQCHFCQRLQSDLRAVRDLHPDDVAIVFRHFPLEAIHPHAVQAALASECAARAGRFEAYHDALFALGDSIGQVSWGTLALRAGIRDTTAFAPCMRDSATRMRVREDIEAGRALGITGTPVILVNAAKFRGVLPNGELERQVSSALQRQGSGERAGHEAVTRVR
jgi:protein-disulfide isomerase